MRIDKFTAKSKDVGGIPVARLLPQPERKRIGAWCFLDHAGDSQLRFDEDAKGLQVGLHPHTNLQTFTWMLAGALWHQDSLGNRQLIRPGQVNLMTAGTGAETGISHTEQTPDGVKQLHAVQLWIALPMDKTIAPSFLHYPQLPQWQHQGISYVLTTGRYHGHQAPTLQYSPLLGVDMQFERDSQFNIERVDGFEYGFLVIAGALFINGVRYQKDELAVLADMEDTAVLTLSAEAGTHLMLLGGEPLPHPTVIWWNFVDRSSAGLEKSVADWNNQHPRFGNINLDGTSLKRLPAPVITGRLKSE